MDEKFEVNVMEKIDGNIVNYSSPEEITIVDIANYFLLKEKMSQKKIQKMCYYAYAWYHALSENDDVLVKDCVFEAWAHGPVNRELRSVFRNFGWREIIITPETKENTETYLAEKLGNEIISFLDNVWESYGHLNADQLEYLSHSEKPWLEQRIGLSDYERCKCPINLETIKDFYSKMAV